MSATFSILTNEQLLDILAEELTHIDIEDMITRGMNYELVSCSNEDERRMFTVAAARIGAVLAAHRERKAANS